MEGRTEPLLAPEANMQSVRHRVQHKLAGQFLEAIDPGQKEEIDNIRTGKIRLSDHMDTETQKQFEAKFEKYRSKESAYSIQNILWLIGSIAVFYYTDFYIAVRYDPRVNRIWFNIGTVLICVNVAIAAFLIIWLSYVKKVSSNDWDKHYPAAIPIATGASILGGICVTVGLWPLWNILTPVILFILFMGFVVSIAMLPNF